MSDSENPATTNDGPQEVPVETSLVESNETNEPLSVHTTQTNQPTQTSQSNEETHHEVTMEMSASADQNGSQDESSTGKTNEQEEEDHYDREEEIVRLLLRVVSFLEVNGHGSHPILATLLAERILSRCGLDPTIRVGYLWKPDAPGVVIPYPWVETFLNGRKDITDITAFGDKSKYIYALGIGIGFGDQCVKCQYHRRVPEDCKVVGTDVGDPDTVPTISAIRREIGNVDQFLNKSAPRVRELYENVLEKAYLD